MTLFFLLLGCDGDFAQFLPSVAFSRLEVSAIDFEQIDTNFVFDVSNPNPVGAPVDRFDYAFRLEDVEILSGNSPDGLELVANGTSEMSLPVSLDFEGIYDAITATRGLDYIEFGLEGGFGFDSDIGPIDILFDEGGSFPALRAPKFDLGKLRVTDVGGSDVGFGLDMNVNNDHGSTLNFRDLDFRLGFAGVQVGGGQLEDLGEVNGASEQTLTLPFRIDYVDAFDALSALATGEPLSVELDATMNVNTPFGEIPLHVDESGNIEVGE